MDDVIDDVPAREIVIPYKPRRHFVPVHSCPSRRIGLVAHRRAGKSVFEINHLQRANLMNPRRDPPPRYGYVGPSFAQAKDLVWGYLKHYSAPIPGMSYSESELTATYPNGGKISLYGGSAAYERMRGLYFDGVALDEFPLLHPEVYNSVVRPALSDYRGFAIVSGTSNGKDHFYSLLEKWKTDKTCSVFDIKVTDTDALHPDEVLDARAEMTRDAFEREYMNSFDAVIEGAYYAEQLEELYNGARVTQVPYDKNAPVITCWDLGLDDETVVWFFQRVGREIHWIDYRWWTNTSLDKTVRDVIGMPYFYAVNGHIFPHDIKHRELSTGHRRIDFLQRMGVDVTVCPMLPVEDGINAVRQLLSISYFDAVKCQRGLSALQSYQKRRDKVHDTNKTVPLHNWASHSADAIRTGAVGLDLVLGWTGGALHRSGLVGALRRGIKGII